MFTGLVEAVGRVERVETEEAGATLVIAAGEVAADARLGDSVCVNGCCLTVVGRDLDRLRFDVVLETLRRTTIGTWRGGEAVNLERSLRLDQRLGGHFVQGHVDGVGVVARVGEEGRGRRVEFEAPEELGRFIAEKGAVAVDGVSLTVAGCNARRFEIAYVPHTLEHTIAGRYAAGHRVHLEVDMLARYVARLMDEAGWPARRG